MQTPLAKRHVHCMHCQSVYDRSSKQYTGSKSPGKLEDMVSRHVCFGPPYETTKRRVILSCVLFRGYGISWQFSSQWPLVPVIKGNILLINVTMIDHCDVLRFAVPDDNANTNNERHLLTFPTLGMLHQCRWQIVVVQTVMNVDENAYDVIYLKIERLLVTQHQCGRPAAPTWQINRLDAVKYKQSCSRVV